MPNIVVIDDFVDYAEMAAGPLRAAGHNVMLMISPIDFDAVLDFTPHVISVGLYRQVVAFDRPIRDFKTDVLGYGPLMEMERYPVIQAVPIALLGGALQEHDVPTRLRYDLFLVLPRDITLYVPRIEALAALKKRRRLSAHNCPNPSCGARLAEVGRGGRDLFCPRCGTGVTVDGDMWHYMSPNGTHTITIPIPPVRHRPFPPLDG